MLTLIFFFTDYFLSQSVEYFTALYIFFLSVLVCRTKELRGSFYRQKFLWYDVIGDIFKLQCQTLPGQFAAAKTWQLHAVTLDQEFFYMKDEARPHKSPPPVPCIWRRYPRSSQRELIPTSSLHNLNLSFDTTFVSISVGFSLVWIILT